MQHVRLLELQERTGERPATNHVDVLSPHASVCRRLVFAGSEGEAADKARYWTSDGTVMCDGGADESIEQWVEDNQDLLSRVLLYGSEDARAYAFALFSKGNEARDVDAVKQELDSLSENEE